MTSLNPLQTIQKQIKESIILHQNLNQNEALAKVFLAFKNGWFIQY